MSVINQMLIDLERRRASGEERTRIPEHVRALPGETAPSRTPLAMLAAVLVAVALIAGGAWWWVGQRPAQQAQPVATAAPPSPKPSAEAPPPEEWIARRLTLDLSREPDPAPAEPPLLTRSVVASRPASPAKTQAAPATAEVPAARTEPPRVEKEKVQPPVQKAVPAVPVEIDKQVRAPTPRQRAEADYARGVALLHQGQFAEARGAFEAALQTEPAHHGARQALVGVLLDGRRQGDAVRVLQEGLQIAPAQHGFAMALARLQVEAGDLDAGVQTLARSLEYSGASPDYLAFYAGLLQRQQKHAEAVAQFQRALSQRNGVGIWLLGLGVSLEALGRGAEAQEAYRRARASGSLSADLQAFAEQRLR